MMKPADGAEKATRQCWECLKRRLVCDYTLPYCKKCQKAGKQCPGYSEQKPLQWVEPGRVTSRKRGKASPPKLLLASQTAVEPGCPIGRGRTSWKAADAAQEAAKWSEEYTRVLREIRSKQDIWDVFYIADRGKIEDIIARGSQDEARRMLRGEKDPLQKLEGMLKWMDLEDIPRYNLSNETCEVVQAVQYCALLPVRLSSRRYC